MVDISSKNFTKRIARAKGTILLNQDILKNIQDLSFKKGDVLSVAQVAAIQAIKNTSLIIPLCHQIPIENIDIDFTLGEDKICCEVSVASISKTGVEMEALMGCSVALLTIYDMTKSNSKGGVIENIYLIEKVGGKSGHYVRENNL